MILVYPTGVRVIVHTANLIYVDWNNKSQGLWMQDFPWKDQNNLGKDGGFENDLVDYLSVLKVQMNSNPDELLSIASNNFQPLFVVSHAYSPFGFLNLMAYLYMKQYTFFLAIKKISVSFYVESYDYMYLLMLHNMLFQRELYLVMQ